MKATSKIFAKLRFSKKEIQQLANSYEEDMNERDRELTRRITKEVFPAYKKQGYLTKEQFIDVCRWKSPRAQPRFESNSETLIKEISRLVLATKSEELRIQLWTLLSGVKWPTASVFLHFAFPQNYPILDFRAIWSLGIEQPNAYNFDFWRQYAEQCRRLAAELNVPLRIFDQALWKYSKQHQPRTAKSESC